MKALIVAEYYPRAADPVRGIWAHRQAVAARDAGAEVMVLVLHRPLPSLSSVRDRDFTVALHPIRQAREAELRRTRRRLCSLPLPTAPVELQHLGAWAAPVLAAKLRSVRRSFAFDVVHAHYAVPSGDAVRRAAPRAPLLVSVHGHDVYGDLSGRDTVRRTLAHARLVLANSAGTARRSSNHGARATRVVHLGADIPPSPRTPPPTATLVTVANLIARKRHQDVISALGLLRDRHPQLRYVIVGEGPERERLRALAVSLGVGTQVELRGQLTHGEAVAAAHAGSLFILPSVDEAFGVAYVEAMAAGVPAIGCRGEDGPEEIAAAGAGIALVPPRDVPALAEQIDALLGDPAALEAMGRQARATVRQEFSWERCGRETVEAYRETLDRAAAAPRP